MISYKKELTAIAVAAAFALPLAAQAETSVTMYGKLYPQMGYAKLSSGDVGTSSLNKGQAGADSMSNSGLASSNSRFGLRGSEDLGNNLKAIFQLESSVGVNNGAGGKDGDPFWNRNTFLGLQSSDFGTLKFGQMDTPYKEAGEPVSFLGVSSGNFVSNASILSKMGFGTSSASSFHLRRSNAITYESPKFSGVQFKTQYSRNDSDLSASVKPWVWSSSLAYEQGPIYAAIAYEYHQGLFGGSKNMPTGALRAIDGPGWDKSSKDRAFRVAFGYRFTKATRIGLDYAHLELKETGGPVGHFERYKHDTWGINVQHKIGAATLQASYAYGTSGSCSLVGADCDASGLKGQQFNIGASYALSKRTYLFAIASKLVNGNSATYSNLNLGSDKPSPGADITQVAVGMAHSF